MNERSGVSMEETAGRHLSDANRLAGSSSPYLRQHAGNPVNWQPWSEAVFAEALRLNKPVLVSIGYSTCHWCHVMEKESFSDPEVADELNRTFVCIKVDREERPDLDAIYMRAAQSLTGGGGWPLHVLLTPEKKPFYAFTYLPKEDRFGRMGLMSLSRRIATLWRDDRERIERSAAALGRALQEQASGSQEQADIGMAGVDAGYRALMKRYDAEWGGFGTAPKFPSPHQLLFLFRHGILAGKQAAIQAATHTLRAMQKGGMHDHVGGGFHRYSTDRYWHLPHFEKMLYDQAMLLIAYTEGWLVSGDASFRETVENLVRYLLGRMQSPEGAFYTAEDADSQGQEGLYYVWSTAEIRSLLEAREADAVIRAFGLRDQGNYADESTGGTTGRNVLDLIDGEALSALNWPDIRTRLLSARDRRPRPFRDEKILCDWNGLAIAALAKAGRAFRQGEWIRQAARAGAFVMRHLWQAGALKHRWFQGEAGIDATLDDYAFLVWGLIELHQATLDARWLEAAGMLADVMLERLAAPEGGLYLANGNDLIARPVEAYDGALPSGNAVAMQSLLRLGRLFGRDDFERAAMSIVRRFASVLEQAPLSALHLLSGMELAHAPSLEIVLAGPDDSATGKAMRRIIDGAFLPNLTILRADAATRQCIPSIRQHEPIGHKATAYVCDHFRCHAPTTDPAELERLIAQSTALTIRRDEGVGSR